MRATWLFCYFLKLEVHSLHGLENISISITWKIMTCQIWRRFRWNEPHIPKISENFWSKEIPVWWFPDPTLKLNNSRTAWPITVIHISFSSILNSFSYEIGLFSRCSSPLNLSQKSLSKILFSLESTSNYFIQCYAMKFVSERWKTIPWKLQETVDIP